MKCNRCGSTSVRAQVETTTFHRVIDETENTIILDTIEKNRIEEVCYWCEECGDAIVKTQSKDISYEEIK